MKRTFMATAEDGQQVLVTTWQDDAGRERVVVATREHDWDVWGPPAVAEEV